MLGEGNGGAGWSTAMLSTLDRRLATCNGRARLLEDKADVNGVKDGPGEREAGRDLWDRSSSSIERTDLKELSRARRLDSVGRRGIWLLRAWRDVPADSIRHEQSRDGTLEDVGWR